MIPIASPIFSETIESLEESVGFEPTRRRTGRLVPVQGGGLRPDSTHDSLNGLLNFGVGFYILAVA